MLFQYADKTGEVVTTAYLWPDDPIPDYPTFQPSKAPRWLALGSGAVAATTDGRRRDRASRVIERRPAPNGPDGLPGQSG